MHDIPDTEDADADAEQFWPETYKYIIRSRVKEEFSAQVLDAGSFRSIYEEQYQNRFSEYETFVYHLSEMIVIGTENGTDEIFDEIYDSFRKHQPLPDVRVYARYYQPVSVTQDMRKELVANIEEEYKNLHAYEHIFEDHYQGALSFDGFIQMIAQLVANGAVNGADDALGRIYRSFLDRSQLPPFRRYPKRIR